MLIRRRGRDGVMRTMRLYVVAIEGNVVRLSFDGPTELQVVREELTLPEGDRRKSGLPR